MKVFSLNPAARADLKAGTLYAVCGEQAWIYYGQVTPDKHIGFLRHRSRELDSPEEVLPYPVMAVFSVAYPSITRALKAGIWKKLGRFVLAGELAQPRHFVQWPIGTLNVTVSIGDAPDYETSVHDAAIQLFERAASWDAQQHVPARLIADFGAEPGAWHIGGPIGRERQVAEETARRFPDQPWHQLPSDWIYTDLQ